MKADYLTYKRATSVSLLGLALQLGMGLTLLIYSALGKDHAGLSGALFILSGCVVWLTLAVVFDQHRRERIEALEIEALSSAREASAFSEQADDLRVAAKRLAWMHRILIPTASLLYAGVLIGLGIWRFRTGESYLSPDGFKSSHAFGWPIAVGLAMAVVGFIFARFVSGMAKQQVWANLRGGAAAIVGAAIVGAALAVGQFIDYYGPDDVIRDLHVAFPITMMVVGTETILNFLLAIYRPRKAGEVPRPAMDSRILGFVAAPDRIAESIGGAINYQFGFDVTSSWFYQLLSRSLVVLVLVGVLATWALTIVGVVQPNEQGLRVRMGKRVGAALQPGPYLKLPWPLERIERFDTATARPVNLGGEEPKVKGSILWTNDHGVKELFFLVQPSAAERKSATDKPPAGDAAVATDIVKDVAMVAAEIRLFYAVDDLVKFESLAAPDQRENILTAVGKREVFRLLAAETVDRILGSGRDEISQTLRTDIDTELKKLDAGVKVLFVGLEGVHPPRETADTFEQVVQSIHKKQGAIDQGETEANKELIKVAGTTEHAAAIVAAMDRFESLTKSLPDAAKAPPDQRAAAEAQIKAAQQQIEDLLVQGGEGGGVGSAAAAIQQARADRWETHSRARGRAELYIGQLRAFRAAPRVYASQIYFQTLKEMMAKARVYIVADQGKVEVRTDLQDSGTTGSIMTTPSKENP